MKLDYLLMWFESWRWRRLRLVKSCWRRSLLSYVPDYDWLYDVRSQDFKNRDKRQVAIEENATKIYLFRFFELKGVAPGIPPTYRCRYRFSMFRLRVYLSRGKIERGTRISLSGIIIKRNKANFANNWGLQSSSLGKLTISRENWSRKKAFFMIKKM